MPRRSLTRLYKDEFTGYSLAKFQQDLLAGLTVAAVALPLALAFGVASGASAAAGLVTAILAGLIMGLLTGAPFQISGRLNSGIAPHQNFRMEESSRGKNGKANPALIAIRPRHHQRGK